MTRHFQRVYDAIKPRQNPLLCLQSAKRGR